jgi:hypothetical protein
MRVATLAVGLVVGGALALQAQETVRVRGTVRDAAGKPIGDVAVQLMPGNRNARSSGDGGYGFDSVAPGRYLLQARRLGFNPMSEQITIRSDTTFVIVLTHRAQLLDTVVVAADCSRIRFSGFLCRRAKGDGIFLTEAEILAKNAEYIPDILRDVKGIKIEPELTAYGQMRRVRSDQTRCLVEAFDGKLPVMREHAVFSGSRTASRMMPVSMHDYYRPEDLIGVEVYPPGTTIPLEYADLTGKSRSTNNCVLVIYWTGHSLPKSKKK